MSKGGVQMIALVRTGPRYRPVSVGFLQGRATNTGGHLISI